MLWNEEGLWSSCFWRKTEKTLYLPVHQMWCCCCCWRRRRRRQGILKLKFSSPANIMTCQGFLQCTLKLLNFLVALVGAYMILYSLWMFKEWRSDNISSHLATPSSLSNPLLSDGNNFGGGNFNILTSLSLQQATDIIPMQQPLGRPFLSSGKKSTAGLSDLPKPWLVLFLSLKKFFFAACGCKSIISQLVTRSSRSSPNFG